MKSKTINGKCFVYLANGDLVPRSQHPDRIAYRRKRYLENKQKENENFRRWYQKNREKTLAQKKIYRINNPEKIKQKNLAYINSERGYLMGLWHGINKKQNRHKTNLTKEIFFKFCYDHKEKMGGWFSGYFNQQMTMQRSVGRVSRKRVLSNMSIDRIDNSKQYQIGNLILCTWKENNDKGAMSIKLMRRVLEIVDNK